ncbi:MAG: dipeptide epimerase [Ginsengibacter sp.]
MIINCKTFDLPFTYPFTISKGTKTHQPTFIVQLEQFGLKGYGEAPAIAYYNIPVEKMIEDLERKRPFIEKFSFTDPERYWHYLHHLFPSNSFLVCALDMAGWDLYGKLMKQPLYQLWELDLTRACITDYTIGIDSVEMMINKMKAHPHPVYKIKLGTDNDVQIIQALRQHTTSTFRIDANAAWQADEALEKINAFKDHGVELIEQPLAKEDWDGMAYLYKHSPLPLFADESCVSEHDVEKCHGFFHGINIKLTKCSGLTPARRMIKKARALEMQVMLGSMNESSIGTSAMAQLMPLADYADIDGPLLLAEDLGQGIKFENGKPIYNNGFGIGVSTNIF